MPSGLKPYHAVKYRILNAQLVWQEQFTISIYVSHHRNIAIIEALFQVPYSLTYDMLCYAMLCYVVPMNLCTVRTLHLVCVHMCVCIFD